MTKSRARARALACGSAIGVSKAGDFYPTPPDVTIALMIKLALEGQKVIWEPACGDGAMVRAIEEHSPQHLVLASDLHDRAGPGMKGVDFLKSTSFGPADWIITNPPFSLAARFIRHACEQAEEGVAMLLKCQYWHASARYRLFNDLPPSDVLPLTWRPEFLERTDTNGGSPMDVLWTVWRKGYVGPTRYAPLPRPDLHPQLTLK